MVLLRLKDKQHEPSRAFDTRRALQQQQQQRQAAAASSSAPTLQ